VTQVAFESFQLGLALQAGDGGARLNEKRKVVGWSLPQKSS